MLHDEVALPEAYRRKTDSTTSTVKDVRVVYMYRGFDGTLQDQMEPLRWLEIVTGGVSRRGCRIEARETGIWEPHPAAVKSNDPDLRSFPSVLKECACMISLR